MYLKGTITSAGQFTASATLPKDAYVTVTARDPTPLVCRFCGRIPLP